jgi:glyoxylase-like metal-dependent hydrolase (beta-lactamase superfamily II)
MPEIPLPQAATAQVHIVHEGYIREADGRQHVGGTVTLIIDGDVVVVVDPGMVSSRETLLAAIGEHEVGPFDVTDVVFSHHHPDHTVNAALFPAAKIHDHWAVYDGDVWIDQPAEGRVLSPSVTLLATPGHTPEDITTLAATPDGVHACTHAWWVADGPTPDPLASAPESLAASRARVLAAAAMIIPGHGAAFVPGPDTPR